MQQSRTFLRRGVTLVEVMIAGAVLALATLATFYAWIGAQQLEMLSREEMIAQAAITRFINDMRAANFLEIPALFSSGNYPDAADPDKLIPGKRPANVGEADLALGSEGLRGVRVETYPFPGSLPVGERWYGPAPGTPELRVVFINDEDPIEAELGEEPGADGTANRDGCDIDGDGIISTQPCSAYCTSTTPVPFGEDPRRAPGESFEGRPLFPRLLAGQTQKPPRTPVHDYRNISELSVLPVIVQVRWWSAAGRPRVLSVFTCVTRRTGEY